MATICLQCGDEGFSNSLVFCVQCLEFAVHRYCLDKLPKTFDEFVYWVCDDCEVKVPNELTIMNSDAVPPGTCTGSRHLKESSEARLDVPPLIAEVEVRAVESKSFKNDVEKQPGIDLVEHSQLRGDSRDGKTSKKKSNPTSVTEKKDSSHAVVVRAQPVYDPIWRGGFNIWNEKYKIIDGLAAHLSVKACQRVWEEAKLFSPFLHFEMLPKSDTWPKSFYTSEPRDDNIALYFFPSDARYEQDYDHLVKKMIGDELALRAIMINAELLVFTSTELPLRYWRFQNKHYLWGVFRTKQDSSSCRMASNRIKPGILQTSGNVLPARDHVNLLKAKTRCAESPISPLSNNISIGSGTS